MSAPLKRSVGPVAETAACTKCKAIKTAADFGIDRARKNGLSCWCKECMRTCARARYYRKRDVLLAHNKVRSQDPAYKAMINAAVRRYAERNPQKRWAHTTLNNAVRRGKLKRGDCRDCGTPNAHAHHHDYSKPFDVVWMCPRCHKAEHARERAAERAA